MALAAGALGFANAHPAHALGLSISQPILNGPTTVTVTGAQITSKSGNLTGLTTNPFDISFTLTDSLTPSAWSAGSGDPFYQYSGNSLYTALSGSSNFLSSTDPFIPANTTLSDLFVYRSGIIEFTIAADAGLDSAPNCYTGRIIVGATSGSSCGTYLNVLNLTVNTAIANQVPDTNTGTPPVGTLLSSFTGNYPVTGSLSSGGAEGSGTFEAVPSPLPILGASTAFCFGRRLRRRIAQSKPSARQLNLS